MRDLYITPEEYFYRCAFPRGRLLSQIEDDLGIFVQIIIKNAGKELDTFNHDFDKEYSKYRTVTEKTIANHRTEMIALFGLIYLSEDNLVLPSDRTKTLWEKQDYYLFFKGFVDKFQFPNGINTSHATVEQLQKGIKFKPAQFILTLLKKAVEKYGDNFSISGAEVSNLIFNDLRVTTGKLSAEDVLQSIITNRDQKIRYDGGSNLSQHGREFMGYLTLANLLSINEENNTFKLNSSEIKSIDTIINNHYFFKFPDNFIDSPEARKEAEAEWDLWFGSIDKLEESKLSTPVSAFSEIIEKEKLSEDKEGFPQPVMQQLKNIGDLGENFVLKYERSKIQALRPDKAGLIAKVSHDTTLGYDIQSLELDDLEVKKHIEVKTTNRTYPPDTLILTWFTMSSNEWNAAKSYKNSYYIYRVFLVNKSVKLFIVKNPVKKEEEGLLTLEPAGYKVILNKDCGQFVEV